MANFICYRVSDNFYPPFHRTPNLATLALTLNFDGQKKWYQQKHLPRLGTLNKSNNKSVSYAEHTTVSLR